MNLLCLGDPNSYNVALVGSKAARLSRLASPQHRVPDVVCLPVTVLDQGLRWTAVADCLLLCLVKRAHAAGAEVGKPATQSYDGS
jgi:hypothetical protein